MAEVETKLSVLDRKTRNARRRAVCSVAFALMLPGFVIACRGRGSEAADYAATHSNELVSATQVLWIRTRGAPGAEIPASDYPDVVRQLEPDRVIATANGIIIYVYTSHANVSGIFVRHDPTYIAPPAPPADSDQPRYERLAPDVYWMTIPR